MPVFKVRLYHGADKPAVQDQEIIADDAGKAAEKACGERLHEQGSDGTLRAIVIRMDGHEHPFYRSS
jgi:hypothetical protein